MLPKFLRALGVISLLSGIVIVSPMIALGSAAPVRAATSPLATPTVSSPLATPTRVPPTATTTRVSPTATSVPPTATATQVRPTPTVWAPSPTPILPSPPIPPSGSILGTHVVRSNETLYCIARAYAVLPSGIASANGMAYPYMLKLGQSLVIPNLPWKNMPAGPICVRQFTSACRVTYIVRSGDTLYSIAVRYQTSVAALMNDNHITNPGALFPGQKLCIR